MDVHKTFAQKTGIKAFLYSLVIVFCSSAEVEFVALALISPSLDPIIPAVNSYLDKLKTKKIFVYISFGNSYMVETTSSNFPDEEIRYVKLYNMSITAEYH